MPLFGKKFGSIYLEIFGTIFIHLCKQVTDCYLIDVDGRLIVGYTLIVAVIYFDDDSEFGK